MDIIDSLLPRTELSILVVVGTKVLLRLEIVRFPGVGDGLVHLINVFKGKTLGLVDEGPHESDTDEAASTPDEEHLGLQVGISWALIDHVRCRKTDGEVEKPVGSGGHGQTLGADLKRVDFTSNNYFRLVMFRVTQYACLGML